MNPASKESAPRRLFCTDCGAEWTGGKFSSACAKCAAVLARVSVPRMPRHSYPRWLIGCALGVLLATAYSLYLVPNYYRAVCLLKIGQREIAANRLESGKEYLGRVLQLVPSSRAAKIDLAIAC